ncbi:MAG: DUF3052 family protein [Bacteroidetes bacterium]|nr:DUF3052 family protein [Bacteroidota bacterium]
MAGYSGTPLQKKLGIKPGMKMIWENVPNHYESLIGPLPEDISFVYDGESKADFIHLFCQDLSTLEQNLGNCKSQLGKNGMLWLSWPKKSSKITTDLDREIVREYGLNIGLVDIKVCAVDENWSGLKFVYRVTDR